MSVFLSPLFSLPFPTVCVSAAVEKQTVPSLGNRELLGHQYSFPFTEQSSFRCILPKFTFQSKDGSGKWSIVLQLVAMLNSYSLHPSTAQWYCLVELSLQQRVIILAGVVLTMPCGFSLPVMMQPGLT